MYPKGLPSLSTGLAHSSDAPRQLPSSSSLLLPATLNGFPIRPMRGRSGSGMRWPVGPQGWTRISSSCRRSSPTAGELLDWYAQNIAGLLRSHVDRRAAGKHLRPRLGALTLPEVNRSPP